ncbi:MAG: type VI secretion system membrane subunit TssM [Myxococcales bacterium]|nr:type VI secretion system membrane subunit TssM [Myxococcales bacterium]
MWKWILLALGVALLWALTFLLDLPLWLAGALTLLLLVGVGLYLGVRHLRARRASKQFESALAHQARSAADGLRPDVAAEIAEMATELERAVAALKTSKLGGGGQKALYALPWYVLIGPPGSGKTTAIRNSGLHFPYLSSRTRRGAVQGIGGTRNCDWWLTNEAVLLDTAGRWTAEGEGEEWLAFLDLLRKHRPRQPLNGILVGVSVDDVLDGGDEGASRVARRLRERIDEVIQRLGTTLPVYLVFTKCDRFPGFVESFEDLPASERGQVWGFTMPYGAAAERELGDAFVAGMDELVGELEGRALARVAEARAVRTRAAVLDLPRQLDGAKNALAAFVDELFAQNLFAETPTLRGVYLTSGTQEGRPIDRLARSLAASLGLSAAASAAPVLEPKSYFLRDVFQRVVFADKDIASPTKRRTRRLQLARLGAIGVTLALSAMLSTLALASWSAQHARFSETEAILARTRAAAGALGHPPTELARWGEQLDALRRPATSLGLGLDRDEALRVPLRDRLREESRALAFALVQGDQAALERFATRFRQDPDAAPTPDEHAAALARLERYLLWTSPTEPSQPPLDEARRAQLAAESAHALAAQAPLPGEGGAERGAWPAEEIDAATRLFERALNDGVEPFARDAAVVDGARIGLRRLRPEAVALAQLGRELDGRGYELSLQRLVGNTGSALRSRELVPGLFTRRAWEEVVRERLEEAARGAVGEPWILGAPTDDEEERAAGTLARLRSEYFAAYVEAWRGFLRSVQVSQPAGEVETLTLLQDLSRGEPTPLGRLLTALKRETELKDPPPPEPTLLEGALDAAAERAAARAPAAAAAMRDRLRPTGQTEEGLLQLVDVARPFEALFAFGVGSEESGGATSLAVYQEQLAFVRDALQTHRDDPTHGAALLSRLQEARTRVRALIEEQPVGWRPRFEAWLWPPLEGASLSSSQSLAAGASRGWCGEVVVPYVQSVDGRYPFDPRGEDMALSDFTAFFKPGGVLWSFYDESLASAVPREGERFTFASRLGRDGSADFVPALPRFLEQAQAVSTAFFAAGAGEPAVDFDVRIRPSPEVASVRLSVGGSSLEYFNGPEQWSRVRWPGDNPAAGATLEIRGAHGRNERLRREGEWGLFRLLEDARVEVLTERQLRARWTLPGHGVEIVVELRAVRSRSPFVEAGGRRALAPLRGIRFPREIRPASPSPCRVRG